MSGGPTRLSPGVRRGLEVRAALCVAAVLSAAIALAPAGPALWTVAAVTVVAASVWPGATRATTWDPVWLGRIAILALFAIAINALSMGEGTRLTVGAWALPISREGLRVGLETAVRLTGMVFLFRAVVIRIEPLALVRTVERWLAPIRRFGIRTESLAIATMIALQVGPTFAHEANRLSTQRALRRGWPGPTAPWSVRRKKLRLGASDLPSLVVPLTQLALRRADELAWALPARHFGSAPRTLAPAVAWGRREWSWLAGASLLLALALWQRSTV